MLEIVKNNEEMYIIIYCLIILIINISYLREFKSIKKGLNDISSEDEVEVNTDSITLMFFVLLFNFFRRWLIYLFAILSTESVFVVVLSAVLFIVGLYDSLFNLSLAKTQKTNIRLYLSIADTLFISIFIIYLFLNA